MVMMNLERLFFIPDQKQVLVLLLPQVSYKNDGFSEGFFS